MRNDLTELRAFAEQNLARHLGANPYPGRGIVVGRLASGAWAQLYWIMGRSPNSRNRRFDLPDGPHGGRLRTEARDPSLVEDPTNIIYEAMLEQAGAHIVTNGDHTANVAAVLREGGTFAAALQQREREDDPPHYTPRIAALLDQRRAAPQLSFGILRANAADPAQTDRAHWQLPPPPPALAYALTTYRTDGSPLPPYAGDPLWLPLIGTPDEVADTYWDMLDADNKISLALKVIEDGASQIILRQPD